MHQTCLAYGAGIALPGTWVGPAGAEPVAGPALTQHGVELPAVPPALQRHTVLPTGADSDGWLLWGPLLLDGEPDSDHLICIYTVCV